MTTATAPITLCQRKASVGERRRPRDRRHAGKQADERAVARRARKGDRQDEDAQDRAVEERPEPVDDLDQRSELRRPDGHRTGKQPPETGRDLRHRQIVRVRGASGAGAACRSR